MHKKWYYVQMINNQFRLKFCFLYRKVIIIKESNKQHFLILFKAQMMKSGT